MRAIRVRQPGGFDQLEMGTDEAVSPGPLDIRVRLHASSLNYHDLMVAQGLIPSPDGRIPMSDGAGEVIEIGETVTGFAVGDRVIGTFFPDWQGGAPSAETKARIFGDTIDGFARDEIVAPATAFTHAPAGYSHAEAATLPCAGLTAWRCLFVAARLQPGETVLVQGTGGVSIFALQIAKAAGARVIATSSSEEKLERLRALGADHVIHYAQDATWGQTAKRLTGGRGVDHVVEIGGATTFAQSIAACRVGGHIGMIGVLAGFSAEVPTVSIMANSLRVSGMMVGSRQHQEAFVRAVEVTGIRPIIDRSFALEEIADAFRHQESGRHFGKICLEW